MWSVVTFKPSCLDHDNDQEIQIIKWLEKTLNNVMIITDVLGWYRISQREKEGGGGGDT